MNEKPEEKIICWWSGGVTSAVACKLAIDLHGPEKAICVFIDTKNEDADTYRFMRDCERWYGLPITTITNENYDSIQDVWRKYKSLNVANGAICSAELKRKMRQEFQKVQPFFAQVFGFDKSETSRAKSLTMNYPGALPVYPLIDAGLSKEDCIGMLIGAGIQPPRAYQWGFRNNNCLGTGCVQGGIGYWQLMRDKFPEKFKAMADIEHELTDAKGHPVSCLKDQSKNGGRLFLLPHPDYPEVAHIGQKPRREVKPVMECNGMCGTFLLQPEAANYETYSEIATDDDDDPEALIPPETDYAYWVKWHRSKSKELYFEVFRVGNNADAGWHLMDAIIRGDEMTDWEKTTIRRLLGRNEEILRYLPGLYHYAKPLEAKILNRFKAHCIQLDELVKHGRKPVRVQHFPKEFDHAIDLISKRIEAKKNEGQSSE